MEHLYSCEIMRQQMGAFNRDHKCSIMLFDVHLGFLVHASQVLFFSTVQHFYIGFLPCYNACYIIFYPISFQHGMWDRLCRHQRMRNPLRESQTTKLCQFQSHIETEYASIIWHIMPMSSLSLCIRGAFGLSPTPFTFPF